MRLSLLALLTLLVLPASAQPTAGLRLGLTVSDLDFGENSGFEDAEGIDQQPRLGLALGVVADVPLTSALSFRPEVLYAQKGYVLEVDIRTTDPISSEPVALQGTQRVEMDYVEVPLLLAVRVPTGSALDVAVEAGPSFAYRTRFHLDCDGDAELVSACDTINAEDDREEADDSGTLRKADLGASLGLTVGAGPFDVGLRYTHGLTSLYDTETISISAKNRVATVNGTYRFRL